jgi:hypothetical protein
MVERRGWRLLLVLGSALASSACGADDGPGTKANSGLEDGQSDSALLCKGAGWKTASVVAAGFLGNDLVLLRADGTRQNAHSFQMPANAIPQATVRGIRTGAGAFTATAGAAIGEPWGAVVGESVRVRKDGGLVWRLNGIAQVSSDAGMGARVNGVPKIVRADGTTSDVPVPEFDSFEFLGNPDADGWMDARWTRYDSPNGRGNVEYAGRVNLDGIRQEGTAGTWRPPSNDSAEWALEEVDYVPAWLVHRPTNTRTPVRLDLLAPLRPLRGMYCNQTTLLEDGRIGVGLRDESTAGFYVGNADGTGWERIGESLRDVTGIVATHVGKSWVVTASSGNNTYCPSFEPFADSDASVVAGDSLQLVAPGLKPFVFRSDTQWTLGAVSLDSTGTCAFRRTEEEVPQTRIFDLSTGESAGAPTFEGFTWL